jgi:uncharacterized protein YlxP (DUF503 family)
MLLVNMQITLNLPYANTIKGKRRIVNSIKERLKNHNLSVLDVSNSYTKEAEIAVAFLALNNKEVSKKIDTIEHILDKFISEIEYFIDYEVL